MVDWSMAHGFARIWLGGGNDRSGLFLSSVSKRRGGRHSRSWCAFKEQGRDFACCSVGALDEERLSGVVSSGDGDGSLWRSKWRRRLGGYATQMKSRGDAEANGGASHAMARAAMEGRRCSREKRHRR